MKKYNIDFSQLAQLSGPVNAYWFNTEHVLLGCNSTLLDMVQKHFNLARLAKKDIIGHKLHDILDKNSLHLADISIQENEEVFRSELPKQFTNILSMPSMYKIKMLTFKAPFYDQNDKLAGVFGISHYLSEVSLASIQDLKFSSRETECLTYLLTGKTMREISEILGISRKTVGTYVERLKAKLNCSTRSQLISRAIELGLQQGDL